MLRRFRARACCLATALVLAMGTTAAVFQELLHAGASHDAACAPALDVAHNPASHQIGPAAAEASADAHCVACHFARSSRAGSQSISVAAHVHEQAAVRPIAAIGSARAAALDSLPPRAPPRLT